MMVLIVLLGGPIEFVRGKWFLWLESLAAVNLSMYFLYKINKKKIFGAANNIIENATIESISNVKSFVLIAIVNGIAGSLFMIAVIFLNMAR